MPNERDLRQDVTNIMIVIFFLISLLSLNYFYPSVRGEEPTTTIRIDGDEELIQASEEYGWSGDGSSESPIMISDLVLDYVGPGTRMFIGNTSKHFIIYNCTFSGGSRTLSTWDYGAGLELYNVTNGTIGSSSFVRNRVGILLKEGDNITIEQNEFERNTYGIIFDGTVSNTARYNTFDRSGFTFQGNRETFVSQHLVNNTLDGREIIYLSNEDFSNDILSFDAGQLILANVSHATVRDIELKNAGVIVAFSTEVQLEEFHVKENHAEGIRIYRSEGISIYDSTLENNQYGINIITSLFNRIENTVLRGNSQNGIVIDQGSHDNIVSNNTLSRNGITIHRSDRNLIKNNRIFRSIGEGIGVLRNSHENVIYLNAFSYNNRARESYNESRIQGRDDTGNNQWSMSETGNYWNDWTSPDEDGDGIVDQPYMIRGSDAKDQFPLVKPPMEVISTPPMDLRIYPGNSSLELKWETPSDDGGAEISHFNLYRGEHIESQTLLTETNKTSYIDTDLTNDIPYFYRVSAVNEVGESVSTRVVKGVPDGTPPSLEIMEPSMDSYHNVEYITVKWNASDENSGIDYHQIRLDGEEWVGVGQNTTYTLTNITEGERTVRVRTIDHAGNEATESIRFIIDRTPPELIYQEPTGYSVTTDTDIGMVFSEKMDTETVNITITSVDNFTYEWIDEVSLRLNISERLEYGTEYRVYVNGSDLAGNEMETWSWNFTTKDGGIIIGRTIDKDGDPIAGVTIRIGDMESLSDNEGRFKFETYSGSHRVQFTKDGFEDKEIDVEVIAGEENDIGDVTLSEIPSSYDLLLIVAAVVVLSTGGMALGIFIIHEKNKEDLDDDLEFEEDYADEIPPEFLE